MHLKKPYHSQSFPQEFTQSFLSEHPVENADGDAVGASVGEEDGPEVTVGETLGEGVCLIGTKPPPPQVQHASFAVIPSSFARPSPNQRHLEIKVCCAYQEQSFPLLSVKS